MQEQDFVWFQNHYKEFQQRYGNAFLAIKNKQIIGVFPTFAEGVRTMRKTEKRGSYIVQECRVNSAISYATISSMSF